jgi:ribosomal protein S18 acetylase RimI-like enzyme
MKIDIKKINEFRKEMMGKHYKPIDDCYVNEISKQKNVYIFMVKKEKDTVVGMAFTYIVKSFTRNALIIEEFLIDKKERSRGYGKALMNEIMYLAKENKVDCIELYTKNSNKIAQKFYSKYGFQDRKNKALRLWMK